MKILQLGNVANNGYVMAKFLRRHGIECDLVVDNSHIFSRPEFEDGEFKKNYNVKEYNPDFSNTGLLFKTDIKIINLNLGLCNLSGLRNLIKLIKLSRGYDVISSWDSYTIFAYLTSKPYIVHLPGGYPKYMEGYNFGDQINLPKGLKGKLLFYLYKKAKFIVLTMPYQLIDLEKFGFKSFSFVPLPIDTEKYKPIKSDFYKKLHDKYNASLIIFNPSRQTWSVKGNNLLIKAFSRFVKEIDSSAHLICSNWGEDLDKSYNLVKKLNIEKNVTFIDPLPKIELIKYINASDIITDQFVLGSLGGSALEAMSCGKPVITSLIEDIFGSPYRGVLPPILNAKTDDQIFNAFLALKNKTKRLQMGKSSRNWVKKFHDSDIIIDRFINIYKSALYKK